MKFLGNISTLRKINLFLMFGIVASLLYQRKVVSEESKLILEYIMNGCGVLLLAGVITVHFQERKRKR